MKFRFLRNLFICCCCGKATPASNSDEENMASLDEEIKSIEQAVERILFDEVVKDIFSEEMKKCAAMSSSDAYNHMIFKAIPRVQNAMENHVSFKHIFDTNSARLGMVNCTSFIMKLVAILDDRVTRGIEVISGGYMGTDFDMQLRCALVNARGKMDTQIRSKKRKCAWKNVSNKKHDTTSRTATSSKEIPVCRAKK